MQDLNQQLDMVDQMEENDLGNESISDGGALDIEPVDLDGKLARPAYTSSVISSSLARKNVKSSLRYLERLTGEKFNVL